MPHRPLILIYFIVVASPARLIPKEMYRLVIDSTDLLLAFDMLQAVCLIPAGGEDVKRNLPADREGKIELRELLLQGRDEFLADLVGFVVSFEVVALAEGAVAADRGDIDHAISGGGISLLDASYISRAAIFGMLVDSKHT